MISDIFSSSCREFRTDVRSFCNNDGHSVSPHPSLIAHYFRARKLESNSEKCRIVNFVHMSTSTCSQCVITFAEMAEISTTRYNACNGLEHGIGAKHAAEES